MKVGDSYSHRLLIVTSIHLVLMAAMGVDSYAQATRTPNTVERRIENFNNQGTKAERDEMNKELRGKKPSAEELKRVAALKAQLKQDLESLQEEYNQLVTSLKAGEPVSVKATAEAGERVHVRAERLLKNLNLPDPKPSDATETKSYGSDTNKLLRSMCSLLFEFITNPMFESPSAIDVESGAKARLTLEELIRLSDHIRQRS